ncbi:MAG TPA: response regulator transcription factor [Epsilonproteobacteria bacterium]|jgi:two-component system KDP operon response regulator KdpE|nr:response regulator transcription factor [Campylobacterota bacterium]
MTKDLVLIVEDDPAISKMLHYILKQDGYKCIISENLKNALRTFQTHNPEIILLDLGLPDGDGKSFIKTVRKETTIPIIIVSARHDEHEIVAALDAGADDYVIKPFSDIELSARIRSAQRRSIGVSPSHDTIVCGDIILEHDALVAYKKGVALNLTPTEFNLLKYFMTHPNQVLTHANVLKEVWGVGYQNEMHYLRTFVNSLRKKIEDDSSRPHYIVTQMRVGYRFNCENEKL